MMAVERKFIEDSILRFKISEFMKGQLSRAGFSNLTIQKTPLITLIIAEVTNPGKVIGRRGKTINEITDKLRTEFKLENPKINISSVSVPDLEPQVIAKRLVRLIEMGKNPRRMMHSMVKSIMEAGAIGCEIIVSGKLAAKGGRAKRFRAMAGYLPKAGEPARQVKFAHLTAYPKAGAIGIRVSIVPPGVQFPDKMPIAEAEPVAEQKPVEQETEIEVKIEKKPKSNAEAEPEVAADPDSDRAGDKPKVKAIEKKPAKKAKKAPKKKGAPKKK